MQAGSKIGGYEILAAIGKGGMGEVFRARDLQLKRDVALKVLPAALAGDPERMGRFQREAELLASLNHPNIASIYGIVQEGPTRALVMELVEGESPKGPLPWDEAWKIAAQIAVALEYAHDRGVIHRDLKPANVLVTRDGVVKLLDFGLAKALTGPAAASGDPENSPTLTMGATVVGTILGTAAYMAPEQAKGKSVDKRADIWAFGVVLWELLTGQRLFQGEDVADTLAQVLTKEPDLAEAPPIARRLLKECLQKDPKARLRDIGDAKRLVGEHARAERSPAKPVLWMALTGVLGLALVAVSAARFFAEQPPAEPVQFNINSGWTQNPLALSVSPDGRYITYIAQDESGNNSLWLRPLGSRTARKVEGAGRPFWSPDSKYFAFALRGRLYKGSVDGGAPTAITDAQSLAGGTWNEAGDILLAFGRDGVIHRVSVGGGASSPVTALGKGEISHRAPQFLPDGDRFVFLAQSTEPGKSGIFLQSLKGGDASRKLVTASELAVALAGPQQLLIPRGGQLFLQHLTENGELAGEPQVIVDDVLENSAGGAAAFSASRTGVLTYQTGDALLAQVFEYRRSGERSPLPVPMARLGQIELSPDGRSLAVERYSSGQADIWTLDLPRSVFSRLTLDPLDERDPVWSSDSTRIAYNINAGARHELMEMAIGSGQAKPIFSDGSDNRLDDWSAGDTLVYHTRVGTQFFALPPGQPRKSQKVYETTFQSDEMRVSPDGKWIAYGSSESGRWEVYVAAFPSFSGRKQVSMQGGVEPHWRRDGRELFFLSPDGEVVAVDVSAGASVETGTPKVLFKTSSVGPSQTHDFAVSPDGQRFYVKEPAPEAARAGINVIVNWPALLDSKQ